MYSLNAPVPGRVSRLAADLAPDLADFDRIRDRLTLVVKRFEDGERDGPDGPPGPDGRGPDGRGDLARLRERLRPALAGAPAVEARVTGIDYFERPVRGPGPVVYLAVESPGLRRLHDRLVDAFGAVEELEGPEYVPHVTLARGGPVAAAERLAAREVDPVTWTVPELAVWDARHRETVATLGLPA